MNKENKTYVLVEKATWYQYQSYRPNHTTTRKDPFDSKRSAQIAINTMLKRLNKRFENASEDYQKDQIQKNIDIIKKLEVMDIDFFEANEPIVERVNLISGKTYKERLNTPSYMSPSSQAYWD